MRACNTFAAADSPGSTLTMCALVGSSVSGVISVSGTTVAGIVSRSVIAVSSQKLLADAKPEVGSETEAFDVDAFVMAMESVPECGHVHRWREESGSVSNTAALSVETCVGATHDKAGE